MRNIKLVIAYLGTAYHGFQKQPDGETVQNILENFLEKVCGEKVFTFGSGRTDAGVHALKQVVNFKTNGIIPCANLLRAAKSMLPKDIVILNAEETTENFHARYSAINKEYEYRIFTGKTSDPFLSDRAWQITEDLDFEAMQKGAKLFLGEHNFSNFRNMGSENGNPIRKIIKSELRKENENIYFNIAGNGFLYHMVRNIMGALVQIGLKKITLSDLQNIIENPNEKAVVSPAPPWGLYLKDVEY